MERTLTQLCRLAPLLAPRLAAVPLPLSRTPVPLPAHLDSRVALRRLLCTGATPSHSQGAPPDAAAASPAAGRHCRPALPSSLPLPSLQCGAMESAAPTQSLFLAARSPLRGCCVSSAAALLPLPRVPCHVRRLQQESSSMSPPQVALEMLQGEHSGVALLTLNRPEARNAIGRGLLSQLQAHLHALGGPWDEAHGTQTPRVLVVASSLPGIFCAGADLKERNEMTVDQVEDFLDTLGDTLNQLQDLPVPCIAAVDGLALGGGLELALACDMRVCGAGAELALPETALAIIPGAGGTQRLPRLVGPAVAKELVFTGRRVKSDEAQRMGLVNMVVERGQALTKALEIARQMLAKGPLALRSAKLAINQGQDLDLQTGLSVERECYSEILKTADREEGLRAFSEKRSPVYVGR